MDKVHGLGTTFACPGNMLKQTDDEAPWSFIAGEIVDFREISISFGSIKRDAYIVTLRSALGNLPTIVGKEMFDTSKIGVGRLVGMNAYVKANFVKDRYPRTE